ncbi:hypothetical protein Lal_00022832 [Lupinus albus]|nr:hypothetical protein Lal_00022832 [Lupinus albus]
MKIAIEEAFKVLLIDFACGTFWKKIQKRLKSCVWNSENPEEFEITWKDIIEDFKLQGNG